MSQCSTCQSSFTIREQDRLFYQKFDAPDPTQCPDCRLQNRLIFRNERTLYQRKSDLSGKGMISIYDPENRYKIYTPEEWWSDAWNPMEYGRDFDFSRPFFEQFQELMLQIPRIGLFNVNPTNSDYCQQAYNNKGCYLCMVVTDCEDSMYLSHANHIKDSFDSTFLQNSELSYECLDSDKLYQCVECISCQNSSNLMFCYDCIGSRDCFASWGLRNKQYYIFNEPYTKEEYEQKVASLQLHGSSQFTKYKQYFQEAAKNRIHRSNRNINCENSTGNYLINAKECHECFDCFQIESSAYCTWIFESNNCYDVYGLGGSEWVYNCLGNEKVSNVAFNTFVSDSGSTYYSDLCFSLLDCFGCAGLRNRKFCILNKEYTQQDYENLKSQIVAHMKQTGEWGQFFPTSLSPFAYNETAAQNYFPLQKEEALAKGYRWKDPDQKDYKPQTYQVLDDIDQAQTDITQAVLACNCTECKTHASPCGKNYKIIPQELNFYKKSRFPIPKKCVDCRYYDRLRLRNPRKLFDRQCDNCSTPIQTSYAPERTEKVYCEKCYTETLI